MAEKVVDINKPVIKNEAGILVDPNLVAQKMNSKYDLELDQYNKRYIKNNSAPIPNISVPYSYILVKAVPPKMKGVTESGLHLAEKEIDVRLAKKLKIMSENVSDEQEVLAMGPYVTEGLKVSVGDIVKINFDRYRKLHDNHNAGVIEMEYDIPLVIIEDNEYLLIDARDVYYSIPKNK